jgi:hypothetical protein
MAQARSGGAFEPEEEGASLHQIGLTVVWASVAVLAITVAVMAARSDSGTRRLSAALESLPWPFQSASSAADAATATRIAREDAEARALAEMVKTLATDRDRLMARIALLERNRDTTAAIPVRTASLPARSDISSLFTGPSLTLELAPDQYPPPVPPIVLSPSAATTVATKTEFGVDLGTAPTMDGLRALWNSLKAQHGGLLKDLQPVMTMQEGAKPGVVAIRLVAGPLADATAAGRLCATLAGTLTACRPTTFEGQRLAAREIPMR